MNRFHPIGCAVEIPHAYDVEVAEKCFAHIPTCVMWREKYHLGWGLSYIHTGALRSFRVIKPEIILISSKNMQITEPIGFQKILSTFGELASEYLFKRTGIDELNTIPLQYTEQRNATRFALSMT